MTDEKDTRESRLGKARELLADHSDDVIVALTGCSYDEILSLRADLAAEPRADGEARRTRS